MRDRHSDAGRQRVGPLGQLEAAQRLGFLASLWGRAAVGTLVSGGPPSGQRKKPSSCPRRCSLRCPTAHARVFLELETTLVGAARPATGFVWCIRGTDRASPAIWRHPYPSSRWLCYYRSIASTSRCGPQTDPLLSRAGAILRVQPSAGAPRGRYHLH